MSDPVVSPDLAHPETSSRRGQSLVEFALVLPMLVVLFLGIADFGRAFSAGITTEAIARNAAEAVAGDSRMRHLKDPSCDATCQGTVYGQLHNLAAEAACDEARRLKATTDTDGTCAGLLVVGACIHDAETTPPGDPSCGLVTGGTVPDSCHEIKDEAWPNSQEGVRDPADPTVPELRYVEVRICYRFTPIFESLSMPIVSYLVDDIYLQRTRTFSVAMDYE